MNRHPPLGDLTSTLVDCIGGPWPAPCPLDTETTDVARKDGYRVERVSYDAEPGDRIAALLLVPDGVRDGSSAPAVAVWHQHAGRWDVGKSEPAGLAGDSSHHTGMALVKEGYVVLCPDALCFEDRQDATGRLRGGDYERFEFLRYVVEGKCLAWKNILDMRRAIDFLVSRAEVDADRIGCYGHSMGSTHAWLVGPHEPRLKAIVANACLPTYAAIHASRLAHCFSNYVPGWSNHGDVSDMVSLIAPRALHINLGERDAGSPIEKAREAVERIRSVYEGEGAPSQFSSFIEPGAGHDLTPRMWAQARSFLARHLGSV